MHINHNLLPPSRIPPAVAHPSRRRASAVFLPGACGWERRLVMRGGYDSQQLAGAPQRSSLSTDTITGGWGELPLWTRFVCPGCGT